MKIFVGIDVAKLNHFAAAISSDGEILLEPFKFTNDADGFQLLISKLESFDKDSIIIGLESTAHYGDNLVRYLVAEFYQVCVLNPIKTCQGQAALRRWLVLPPIPNLRTARSFQTLDSTHTYARSLFQKKQYNGMAKKLSRKRASRFCFS